MSTIQTAFLGVGYMSTIGAALNISGQILSTDVYELLDEPTAIIWFSGSFLSCLFWVRYII